jgi:hypothetical protein
MRQPYKHFQIALIIFIFIFAIAIHISSATAQVRAPVIDNWAAACDNTVQCEALGVVGTDKTGWSAVRLSIDRGAKRVNLYAIALATTGIQKKVSFTVGDFKVSLPHFPDSLYTQGLTLSDTQAVSLLREISKNKNLIIRGESDEWRIPLEGLKGQLKWVSQQQKTLKPLAVALNAPPLPKTTAADSDRTSQIYDATSESERVCPEIFTPEATRRKVTRLNNSKLLLTVECEDGQYRNMLFAWISNDQPPFSIKQLGLSTELKSTGQVDIQQFDGFQAGSITSTTDQRRGNCQSSQTWTWDGQRFSLTSSLFEAFCDDIRGSPFLRIWHTELLK